MNKKNFSVLGKMVLAYSALLCALLIVIMSMAYRYILDLGEKNALVHQEQLMEKALSQMDGWFNEMGLMAKEVSGDSRIINIFEQIQQEKIYDNYFDRSVYQSVNFSSILNSLKGPGSPMRIDVCNQYGDFISSNAEGMHGSHFLGTKTNAEIEQLMQILLNVSTDGIIVPPDAGRATGAVTKPQYISLIYPLSNYYRTEIYGVVEVRQNAALLEEWIQLDPSTGITVFLFNERGEQVLPLNKSFTEAGSGQFFTTQRKSQKNGWSIALVQSREHLLRPYRSIIGYLYASAIIILISMIIAVYLIARRFAAPITDLRDRVRNIRIGNIPASLVPEKSMDEMRELSQAFTALLNKLGHSIEYEKKAYLLALQSQMDPHFLFNSLSIISSMGVEVGSEKIVEVCGMLGSMLSYSTSYDSRDITLKDELDNAKNYLEMMKLRFEDQFSYIVDADFDLNPIPMPKLVLQPILENCFAHAFKEKEPPWKIGIRVYRDGGDWVISIADDGIGFPPERLQRLAEKIKEYSGSLPANYHEMKLGGLGLVNTIIRMRLFMNGAVAYSIEPNQPSGTIVTLRGGIDDTYFNRRG